MGIRVRADTREGLIAPAANGLYAAFGELTAADDRITPFHFDQEGKDDAVLLRDFLTELLILFEREHRILTAIESVDFSPQRLQVAGKSARVDQERSVFCREVKAVTYHDLRIERVHARYEATLIVDI